MAVWFGCVRSAWTRPRRNILKTGIEPVGPEAEAANRRLGAGMTVPLDLDVQPWDRYYCLLA
jgi:hypothetical protein